MCDTDKVNFTLAEISAEEQERRTKLYADMLEEEAMNNELLRQHEMMSYAAELESFSPFDTMNS